MQPFSTSLSTAVKAEPLQRLAAFIIDALVGGIPYYLLILVSGSLAPLGALISIGYMTTRDALPATGGYLGGQSIGKKLLNIKAVREDTGASLLGDYGTTIIRQITLYIPFFNIVDALMVFSSDRKRFGDKWAKTIVVKV